MNRIEFEIPGLPTPFARAGTAGKQRFTPRKQADFMAAVRLFASRAMAARPPLVGPVQMDVSAVYVPAASWSKRKRETTIWRAGRPDVDNLAKLIGDSANGICYLDDAQIAKLTVRKIYGLSARTLVTIAPLEGGAP